jgi:nucleotide-binding universal stress UspA family protein
VSERPIVACYRGLDSIDAVQLGARLAATLHEPLVLASAYRYDPAGLSARAMPDADNERRAVAAQTALRRAYAVIRPDVDACALVLGRDTQGHVTRSLVPRAPCPVAVAPLSVPLPQDHGLECIGVAVDGSRTASWALVAAARLAQEAAARLVLLAAGPTMARAQTLLQAARLSLDREPESLELRALVGDAPATLAQAGGDLDLLVCGSRGLRRPLAAILGSVSSHLVGHAPCPVLVVPPTVAPSPSAPLGLASARAPSGA